MPIINDVCLSKGRDVSRSPTEKKGLVKEWKYVLSLASAFVRPRPAASPRPALCSLIIRECDLTYSPFSFNQRATVGRPVGIENRRSWSSSSSPAALLRVLLLSTLPVFPSPARPSVRPSSCLSSRQDSGVVTRRRASAAAAHFLRSPFSRSTDCVSGPRLREAAPDGCGQPLPR